MNLEKTDWVTVRDHKNNLIFDGWIQAFSEDPKESEHFLRDVSIYKNDTGEQLYQAGAVYLSRNRHEITLEYRAIPLSEGREWEGEKNNDRERPRPEGNIEGEFGEKRRGQPEAGDATATTTEGAKPVETKVT